MAVNKIDAALLRKMFIGAAYSLEAQKETINELNVFPVPDGDTGTNMSMTIMSAVGELNKLDDSATMEEVAKAISSGSLRGARGNSGVILSQLMRGFTKVIKDETYIDVDIAVNAFQRAVETAYKAVMKPKEGTILTVARGGADRATELLGTTNDMVDFSEKVIASMEEVLAYTPELLPVLKEAGVVDSGGRGLIEVMKGAYDVLCGKEVKVVTAPKAVTSVNLKQGAVNTENISTADIKFGYCTEFIIMLDKEFDENEEAKFKAYLESIGDSIVCVADDEIVKIHVHTNNPGLAIEKALTYGQLTKMKIDNMREEHTERLNLQAEKAAGSKVVSSVTSFVSQEAKAPVKNENTVIKRLLDIPDAPKQEAVPTKENGFVAISVGSGLNEIFKGLGVDHIIEGGQTMNPSTEDIINAIEATDAKNVYVLPNNKNIILAAQQAQALVQNKNVVVIPTKTVPQGIAAMINFLNDKGTEENEAVMTEAIENIKTGQITYSVRDTKIDGLDIKMGDYMGLDDHTIKSTGSDVVAVSVELIESMIDDDSELVSIYYGVDGTKEQAEEIVSILEEKHKMVDFEVHAGNQPVYYYIVSVE